MKVCFVILSFCLLLCGRTLGQVSVDLELDQDQFLPNESLVVKVRITNFSGRSLRIGANPNWLSFGIDGDQNQIVASLKPLPEGAPFELESSSVGTRHVDVAPCFNLTQPGHYKLRAVVRIPELQQSVASPAKGFDIIRGSSLWEQDFGVPSKQADSTALPEIRKYSLIQAIHLRRIKLYLRISAPSGGATYRVFPLGPLVSFSNPEHQIDRDSCLHILYQTGARSFHYFKVNPDGEVEIRQTHQYAETRPVLRPGPDGTIRVLGGARLLTNADIPTLAIVSDSPREPASSPAAGKPE